MDDQRRPHGGWRHSRRRIAGIAMSLVVAVVAVAVGAIVVAGALEDEPVAAPVGGPSTTRAAQESEVDPHAVPSPSGRDEGAPTPSPGSFESTGKPLLVGKDIAPGLYIASDAAPLSIEGGLSCFWSVSDDAEWPEEGYYDGADVEDGTAMLLAPIGLWVSADPSCGTWEAVNPGAAFKGADGTVASMGRYVVGRDIVPGTYLSRDPIDAASACMVVVTDYVEDRAFSDGARYPMPAGGSMALDLRAGEVLDVYECPPFAMTDLSAVVAQDGGLSTFEDGSWLVGVDVRPGAYRATAAIPAGTYCEAAVWSDYRGPDGADLVADIRAAWSVEPAEVHLEAGQVISAIGCGPWTPASVGTGA